MRLAVALSFLRQEAFGQRVASSFQTRLISSLPTPHLSYKEIDSW